MAIQILEEIKKLLPENANISTMSFEGANIILYTKNKDFFLNNNGMIREIVNTIKKRVELRPDPSMPLELEKAETEIKKILPKEAGKQNIIFDPQRSQVVIEVEKPGIAIGKAGEILKKIKEKTLWVPLIKRIPAIRSQIIENVRQVLYENNDYRKKFLNKVGERIYGPKRRNKKTEWIRITALGAARQVGRSCFLLQTPESSILLDCGQNVAAPDDYAYPFFDAPELRIDQLDAVIVSHAHVDHSSLVPLLFKYGYKGPVYCTAPTRDITSLLGLDIIGIAQKDAKTPLYSSTEIKEMVKHTIILDYEEVTDITPDIRLTLYDAGHILGSALVHLHIGDGVHNFVYTGDFNYELSNLLAPSNTRFPRVETLMLESTYGTKEESSMTRQEAENYVIDVVEKTLNNEGKVLFPVLGVGRSQELMVIFERLMREGKIKKVPIYIQGLVWDINAIHTAYPDFFNNRIKKQIFHQGNNPFTSDIFQQIGSRKEMEQVWSSGEPCIIMATSGMLTGGASVEYFKELCENPKNSLILTSYQGPGSLGRRLEEGEKEIGFMARAHKQEMLKVNMEIHSVHGFTGHSTYKQLIGYVKNVTPRPKKVIFVHGESSRCLEMASTIHKMFRIETLAPKNLETIRLR
tara:strand:- start:7212 stop:9116 length:1905 start_codon:yes stop_codon:yes gene_type:complete